MTLTSRPQRNLPSAAEQQISAYARDAARDQRALRRAIAIAVAFHLGLLAITFPSFTSDPPTDPERPKVYVVEPVRFKAPPPDAQPVIPKARAIKIPMPDPTPQDPEPVTDLEPESFDEIAVDDLAIAIPLEAPEPPARGPVFVTDDVSKPISVLSPAPRYTEIARKARVTGTVILQSTIDDQGNVTDVKVLKGLPMGLSDSAVDAVRQWKFKPALLDGKPVAVYFNLTVKFSLS